MVNASTLRLAIGAATCLLLVACGKGEPTPAAPAAMPEVNDANCQPDAISRMDGKDLQQRFSALCLRRGGNAPSSPKKTF